MPAVKTPPWVMEPAVALVTLQVTVTGTVLPPESFASATKVLVSPTTKLVEAGVMVRLVGGPLLTVRFTDFVTAPLVAVILALGLYPHFVVDRTERATASAIQGARDAGQQVVAR